MIDRLERYKLTVALATDQGNDGLLRAGWDEALLNPAGRSEPARTRSRRTARRDSRNGDADPPAPRRSRRNPPRKLSSAALNALRTRNWPNGYPELRARSVRSRSRPSTKPSTSRTSSGSSDRHSNPRPARCRWIGRCAGPRAIRAHVLRIPPRPRSEQRMTRIAERTGVERTHLYRKLRQLGLHGGRRTDEGSTE